MRRFALAGVLTLLASFASPAAARAADPWLFVNDIHLSPTVHDRQPSHHGKDTDPALLTSAIAEMRRVAPHPAVIVMAGDFLDHGHHSSADAAPTLALIARRFDAAFPHAQFVMTLGNEDSACGDYGVGASSAFLAAVARAWEPLVNRNGAAPDFVRTFSRDGFYIARLPVANLRAVVVDDAFWSPFYHETCGSHRDPIPASLTELERALEPSATQRRWLIMHIPPGVDVHSTLHRTRNLIIVPFLQPGPRNTVLRLAADPARHVELVVTAHIHRFGYRIIEAPHVPPVPVLVAPAISPIFANDPAFLRATMSADGHIVGLEEYARLQTSGVWRDIGGLKALGVSELTGPALVHLHARLAREPALRETYSRLYSGEIRRPEIDRGNWRSYWCAATNFASTEYRGCLDEGGLSFLTRRGVGLVAAAALAVVVVLGAAASIVIGARRRRAR